MRSCESPGWASKEESIGSWPVLMNSKCCARSLAIESKSQDREFGQVGQNRAIRSDSRLRARQSKQVQTTLALADPSRHTRNRKKPWRRFSKSFTNGRAVLQRFPLLEISFVLCHRRRRSCSIGFG